MGQTIHLFQFWNHGHFLKINPESRIQYTFLSQAKAQFIL